MTCGCDEKSGSPETALVTRNAFAAGTEVERRIIDRRQAFTPDNNPYFCLSGARSTNTNEQERSAMNPNSSQDFQTAMVTGEGLLTGKTAADVCALTPDNAIGMEQDIGGEDWHRTQRGTLPCYIDASGGTRLQNPDYLSVGTVAQLRAAISLLAGYGLYDSTIYSGAYADPTYTISPNPAAGVPKVYSVGFQMDWGIALQSYQPFDATLVTSGFQNNAQDGTVAATYNVDRNFRIRFDGRTTGGRIFVPWAYRSPTGMLFGQVQTAALYNVVASRTIVLTGIPAGVGAAFSAQVQFLAAFTRQLAEFAFLSQAFVGR